MSNEQTRRRVLVSAPDVVEVVTEAVPSLKAGEVLVRMSVSGVCGIDKAGVHGVHAFMKPPYYPGHEVVGAVAAVADGVEGGNRWRPGHGRADLGVRALQALSERRREPL